MFVGIMTLLYVEPINNSSMPIYISIKNCDVQKNKCKVNIENFNIEISLDKDIYYLKRFDINIVANDKADIESAHIYFKMKNMNMGKNYFVLKKTVSDNKLYLLQGTALLPICVTGRADWFSELEVVTKTNKYIIEFPIVVKKIVN